MVCCVVFCSESPRRCETEFEPVVDRLLQLRLALLQGTDHALQPRHGLILLARQIGHEDFGHRPTISSTPKQNGQDDARRQSSNGGHNREDHEGIGHRQSLRDSGRLEQRANSL